MIRNLDMGDRNIHYKNKLGILTVKLEPDIQEELQSNTKQFTNVDQQPNTSKYMESWAQYGVEEQNTNITDYDHKQHGLERFHVQEVDNNGVFVPDTEDPLATHNSHNLEPNIFQDFQCGIKQEPELDLSTDEEPITGEENEAWEHYGEEDEYYDNECHEQEQENEDGESVGVKGFQITYLSEKIIRPFQCKHCLKDFLRECDLERHQRVYNKIEVQCPVCQEQFSQRCILKAHLEDHAKYKVFKCPECPMEFQRRVQLTAHIKTHTGENLFKCPECSKIYSRKQSLIIHLRVHAEEKPFKCPLCSKGFITAHKMNIHIRTHTGEKPYKCYHCPKSFSQSCTRDQHLRTHTGERPFNCNYCSKTFSQSSNRDQHELIHTGVRPYKCASCSKGYYRNREYQRHLLTHLKDRNL